MKGMCLSGFIQGVSSELVGHTINVKRCKRDLQYSSKLGKEKGREFTVEQRSPSFGTSFVVDPYSTVFGVLCIFFFYVRVLSCGVGSSYFCLLGFA